MNPPFQAVNVDCNFDYAYERERLSAAGITLVTQKSVSEEDIIAACTGADVVVVEGARTPITERVIQALPRCRLIVKYAVGVDNIDVAAATRKGIVVMNTPGGNTVSAAEHTIALMTALARHIPTADAVMKSGKWDRNKFVGTQLTGKTLGVIGLGRIGREVANRALGLGMSVVGFDPFVTPDKVTEMGYGPVGSVTEMLPAVDFLSVHVPFTAETKGLIGKEQLAAMKKSARVLNVARGGIIDEQALADALKAATGAKTDKDWLAALRAAVEKLR
jgi:D-3-phosphoglycerate dehydrogenase